MTMELNLKDIIIPEKFKQSIPNDYKIANVNIDYDNGEDIGKEIIVNTAGELIDGYIRYLVLLYRGVERAEITIANKVHYKNVPTKYVFGKHKPDGKTYVWRMTRKTKHPERLAVGSRVQVATKHGDKRIIVEKIEVLDAPPVDTPVRKVRECYQKPREQ